MPGRLDLLLTPPTLEEKLVMEHSNELVLLDKEPYTGELPLVNYGFDPAAHSDLPDIPPPRANTYVLNIKKMSVEEGVVRLQTNYTTMRSQFALRRWVPALVKKEEEWEQRVGEYNPMDDSYVTRPDPSQYSPQSTLLLQHVLPIGAAMIVVTADNQILMEERGKDVQVPGKYHPVPAGGCETRDYQVLPEPFRCIMGEAWEEAALLPGKDYGVISLLGVARDQTEGFNPVLTYHVIANLPLDEIKRRADNIAPEAGEHQRLFGVPAHPEKLLEFCCTQENTEKLIGNGLGALLVFSDYKFGSGWFADAASELGKQGWEIKYSRERFP